MKYASWREDSQIKMDHDDIEISSDDEHLDHTAGPSQSQVVCETCGSTRFYRDNVTDSLICTACFTQSQTLSQRETVDLEDAFTSAKRGGVRRSQVYRRSTRNRDEDLDNSQPLPELKTCLQACQLILKIMAEKAFILSYFQTKSGTSFEKEKGAFVQVVGDIWFQYLKAWQVGAQHFSQIFPEHRFSLRDSFLNRTLRGMVVKHLSARAIRDLKKNGTMGNRVSVQDGKTERKDDRKRKRVKFEDNEDEERPNSPIDSKRFESESTSKDFEVNAQHETHSQPSVKYYRPT